MQCRRISTRWCQRSVLMLRISRSWVVFLWIESRFVNVKGSIFEHTHGQTEHFKTENNHEGNTMIKVCRNFHHSLDCTYKTMLYRSFKDIKILVILVVWFQKRPTWRKVIQYFKKRDLQCYFKTCALAIVYLCSVLLLENETLNFQHMPTMYLGFTLSRT